MLEERGKDEIYKGYGTGALKQMVLSLLLINENNWGSTKDVQFNKSFLRFYYVPGTILGTWVTMTQMNKTGKIPAPLATSGGKEI